MVFYGSRHIRSAELEKELPHLLDVAAVVVTESTEMEARSQVVTFHLSPIGCGCMHA